MMLNLILQIEVLFVNLLITDRITTRKYSKQKVIIYLLVYTIIIVGLLFVIPPDKIPTGTALIIGVTYIIPLSLLYNESIAKMTTIMFFCWTQTMIISNISLSISVLINSEFTILGLLIQSVLLIGFYPLIRIFAQKKYKTIIEEITKEAFPILFALALLLLSLTVFTSYFLSSEIDIIIALLLVALTSIAVYTLMQNFVLQTKRVQALNDIAFTDSLTKIGNRVALFTTAKEMIQENTPFIVLYMDLDNFKSINDTYGHNEGDQYIIAFIDALKRSVPTHSLIFRIAGDEFVCLCKKLDFNSTSLNSTIANKFLSPVAFNGVSVGSSMFPKDNRNIDELLNQADNDMYKSKYHKSPLRKKIR